MRIYKGENRDNVSLENNTLSTLVRYSLSRKVYKNYTLIMNRWLLYIEGILTVSIELLKSGINHISYHLKNLSTLNKMCLVLL